MACRATRRHGRRRRDPERRPPPSLKLSAGRADVKAEALLSRFTHSLRPLQRKMTGPRAGNAGQTLPVVVLFMFALIGCAALAIDVGAWYLEKRHCSQRSTRPLWPERASFLRGGRQRRRRQARTSPRIRPRATASPTRTRPPQAAPPMTRCESRRHDRPRSTSRNCSASAAAPSQPRRPPRSRPSTRSPTLRRQAMGRDEGRVHIRADRIALRRTGFNRKLRSDRSAREPSRVWLQQRYVGVPWTMSQVRPTVGMSSATSRSDSRCPPRRARWPAQLPGPRRADRWQRRHPRPGRVGGCQR